MDLLPWHNLIQGTHSAPLPSIWFDSKAFLGNAEQVLKPGGGAIDGVALLSPLAEVFYAFGSLQQDLSSDKEEEARQQFVGLFEHRFRKERKRERMRQVADGAGSQDPLPPDDSRGVGDEESGANATTIFGSEYEGVIDQSKAKRKPVDPTTEGFKLLGQKLAVCNADLVQVLAISAGKRRGLVIRRLPDKGEAVLLITFAPARPHTTQRVVSLVELFASRLR